MFSDNETVAQIIDKSFDPNFVQGLTYAGVEAPAWEPETLYNRLNIVQPQGFIGVSYFYRVGSGDMRYIVEYGSETRVYDYGEGFVPKNLTIRNDFIIQQCVQRLFLE